MRGPILLRSTRSPRDSGKQITWEGARRDTDPIVLAVFSTGIVLKRAIVMCAGGLETDAFFRCVMQKTLFVVRTSRVQR